MKQDKRKGGNDKMRFDEWFYAEAKKARERIEAERARQAKQGQEHA
jgi:hypothetical protein